MVGQARFELATPCSQSKCANLAALLPDEGSGEADYTGAALAARYDKRMDGGMAELRRIVHRHYTLQAEYEATSEGTSRLLALAIPLVLTIAAVSTKPWLVLLTLPAGILVAKWLWNRETNRLKALHDRVPELRAHLKSSIFDGDIWRELIEDDGEHEVMLGPIHITKVPVTFGARVRDLFVRYPQLCQRHKYSAFPQWYFNMLPVFTWSQKNRDWPLEHLWQYALAQVFEEEFLAPRQSPENLLQSLQRSIVTNPPSSQLSSGM